MPGEDGVRRLGRELAALFGVPGLEDHGPPLGATRHVEVAGDLELVVAVAEGPGCGVRDEDAGGRVRGDLVSAPRVEQLPGREHELLRPVVAILLRQKAPAAEVLPGERIPGCDHVPGRPPAREVVEGGELPGDLVGLVEGRVDGAGQAQPVGDGGEGGQDREGIRAADHIQVIDLPALLPQPQPLRQEEEVEAGSLGGTRHVRKGAEVHLTPGARIAPHGGVVDAGEMGGEMHLPGSCHPTTCTDP